jgi:signal transduction histidine kinase/HAMP domain-containing protein
MSLFARLRQAIDPRRSIGARLLFGFFLAFLIPGAVFVLFLSRKLSDLQQQSLDRLTAMRLAQASAQVREDASFRSVSMDRRVAIVTEAVWALADSARLALAGKIDVPGGPIERDEHGHVWTPAPEDETIAFIAASRSESPESRRDFARSRALSPLFARLRERHPSIRSVSLWTASGVMRLSPWTDLHEAIRQSGGALESFTFNETARFPENRPPGGDEAVWTAAYGEPRVSGEARLVSLFIPVRDDQGRLSAGISAGVDARQYVAEALDAGSLPGDFWFATDSLGHAVSAGEGAARLLAWNTEGPEMLSSTSSAERARLARAILSSPRSEGDYTLGGRAFRLASARVLSTGWVFVEGLSAPALAKIAAGAAQEIAPKSYSVFRRYLVAAFLYLLAAMLAAVFLVSRRFAAPIADLVQAAEEIGRGRPVALSRPPGQDELGRLAIALNRTGRRVERRVETLNRLHSLLRQEYRGAELPEIIARSTEAIAAFTRAERVWFFLHDPNTNRLQAAWPGWNLSEDLAARLHVPIGSRSTASQVFRGGEVCIANDLVRDPSADRELLDVVPAGNALFCPLKTEEETLGVVVATDRPGGFGQEEADAVTSFADAASLLIRNARLYATLTGTVEELRRASRLKDHFLQNVNHELRTPLTSIVGWTDLLEEQTVDETTLRRGLKQTRQSARVLLALIDDLLDLARMDRGTLSLDLSAVTLADVVNRSIETVRLMAEGRGVVMILAPLPESMPPVRADPLRLQQVLWNLLANAIKFTPRHGRVIVRLEREPERYLVSVEDDGIGIPENELPHVFERFRQADGSPTRRHSGMGIGLALARSLVELHGGAIWADSEPGHGSRFTFSLPITPMDRRSEAKDSAAEEKGDGRRKEELVEG